MKETIRALQGMARLSNIEMQRRTGINRTTYASRIDPNDPAEVSAPEIELIATALGVSVGTLYLPVDKAVQQALGEGLLADPEPRGHATPAGGRPTTQQDGCDRDLGRRAA